MTDSLDGDDDPDELYHDENTIVKARNALLDAAGPYGHGDSYVDDLLYAMQSVGIVFRERRK